MAAEMKPLLGIVDGDDHVRLTLRAMDGIAASLEQYERRVRQLENRVATLTAANTALADENAKLAASRDIYKAQLEGRTRDLMARHEDAVKALNAGDEG